MFLSAAPFMALPCQEGKLADMDALGPISLHFLQSVTLQHLSQGVGRKLSQRYCHSSPVLGLGTGDGGLDGTSLTGVQV